MSWLFQQWERDLENRAQRIYDPDSGGWFVLVRDPNGAYSTVWKPDLAIWANAIGQGVVNAEKALVPVSVALDVSRVRSVKQPRPGPKQ